MTIFYYILLFFVLFRLVSVGVFGFADYYLKLSSTAPAIEEVNVTFYADLFENGGKRPYNETYTWVSGNSICVFFWLAVRFSDGLHGDKSS